MLSELKEVLNALETFDTKMEKNVFQKGEIQKEIDEINDFPELLDDIHQKVSILQQTDIHEFNKIVKTFLDLNATLGSCINNIELVRDLVKKLRNHFYKSKTNKSDA